MVGLYHYKNSACLMARATVEPIPGHPNEELLRLDVTGGVLLVAIVDLNEWECFCYEWKSWVWQVQQGFAGSLTPGIRAFKRKPADSIMRVAAWNAYWNLPKCDLEVIASHKGLKFSAASSLFDCVFRLVSVVLELDDEKVCSILRQRLFVLLQSNKCAAEILACDEASACLKNEDRDDLKLCQTRVVQREHDISTFKTEYKEKKKSLRGGKAGKKKLQWKGPTKIAGNNMDHMQQAQAKKFLPPESSLWRSRGEDAWNARHRDMPTRSARDRAWGGEGKSLVRCLQWAWSCFLSANGHDDSECPITDLWTSLEDTAALPLS